MTCYKVTCNMLDWRGEPVKRVLVTDDVEDALYCMEWCEKMGFTAIMQEFEDEE